MKRRTLHQVVPAIIMAGAAAVPVVTTVEILTHASPGSSLGGITPSAPLAAAPSRTFPRSPQPSGATSSTGTRTIQGPVVNDPFGGVQATVTLNGPRITDVAISAPQDNFRSASINQQAVPLLRSETLQAQSPQINLISGATLTSQAYIQSLQAALNQAPGGTAGASSSSPSAAGHKTSTHIVVPSGSDD